MRQICLLLLCFAALIRLQAQDSEGLIHTVEAGQTLTSIANSYGVSLDELLSLNSLDPDAYLQIGQRLLVVPDAALRERQAEADDSDEPPAIQEPRPDDNYAGAPIVEAKAPMMDPAELSPQLCLVMYEDANHNGMREADELRLRQGRFILRDAAHIEAAQYTTDGESEPYCLPGLERQRYRLEAAAPAGYSLSGGDELWLDLRAADKLLLEFGARQGEAAAPPVYAPEENNDAQGSAPGRLLSELSGLAMMVMAGAVMAGGMLLALFLRSR